MEYAVPDGWDTNRRSESELATHERYDTVGHVRIYGLVCVSPFLCTVAVGITLLGVLHPYGADLELASNHTESNYERPEEALKDADGWFNAVVYALRNGGQGVPVSPELPDLFDIEEPAEIIAHAQQVIAKPEVVCLCGSTRFAEQFGEASKAFTLAGQIVLSPGLMGHSGDLKPEECEIGHPVKDLLDTLHFRRIDMATKVFVVDVGGYIGDSTRNEIQYAQEQGKPLSFWSVQGLPERLL